VLEIQQLETRGNSSADWSLVRVVDGFDPARVSNSTFHGHCTLGRLTRRLRVGGVDLPAGICDSTLIDCVVGNEVLVHSVKFLVNYVIGPGAVVLDCGRVTCEAGATFANGSIVHVGCETGGRPVQVFAEMGIELASLLAQPKGRRELLDRHTSVMADYRDRAASPRGVIERNAQVLNTPVVRTVFIGSGAIIDGATLLENCTLLSSEEEPVRIESGACVRETIVQWGSCIETMAIVEGSLLTEHTHVERHGKVSSSILGPNTSVGGGEVTASLLGPFIACHHQSLLIATLWPEGRGNLGYGANVGSNHTSRAPDQECRVGEGVFFGLGVNVKFPADLSGSPYSVVACGANLLPQKVRFPFSLIATPSVQNSEISPAYMEIVPGWVLRDNLYALRRNEDKFRTRNKARRTRFVFDFLRADTVELIRDALRRLEDIGQVKEFYTEEDIQGLGKNFLLEKHRLRAIETYTFFLQYYSHLALLDHLRLIVGAECPGERRPSPVADIGNRELFSELRELPDELEKIGQDVEESKARDDRRGVRILNDYTETHTPAAQDDCVRRTWEEVRRLQAECEELLTRLRNLFEQGPRIGRGCRVGAPLPGPAPILRHG
jgi:hypothetical protein